MERGFTVQEALLVIVDSDDYVNSLSDPEDCDTHFERLDPAEDQLDEVSVNISYDRIGRYACCVVYIYRMLLEEIKTRTQV